MSGMVRAKPSSGGVSERHGAEGAGKRGGQQESAYALLKEMIILQDLPAGTLVSELSLSKRLGLGRSSAWRRRGSSASCPNGVSW